MTRFAIGIDLGTTNSALAWIDLSARTPRTAAAEVLPIPQLIDVAEVESRPLLPSFVYLPAREEFPAASLQLPWSDGTGPVVGEAARKLGSKVPGRFVASAKSWLCHAGVDRQAKILPWQTESDVERISPVEASKLYLAHLRDAWNNGPGSKKPEDRLEEQTIVLTIPASFDEVARELTVDAARRAGFKQVVLLEEPQAAFYQWLERSDDREPLAIGTTCVVIDCGGGTTDFSLLSVVEEEGRPIYQRIAVGDHLLLGGDNIDIAIARQIEQALSPQRRFDLGQWWNLVIDARRLKEAMLDPNGPDKLPVAVLGRGRRVIGDVLKTEIDRSQVLAIGLDGFFPIVGPTDFPEKQSRVALQEFGLPFVSDPAITKHLAAFLHRHADQIAETSPTGDRRPDAVLFNGGVFNARLCRDRVLEVMTSWYGADWKPRVLTTSSLDLAVAQGAAQFGYRRATGGERIKSGAARSYYVGIGGAGTDGSRSVLCIVPQGLEEGERIAMDQPPLELQLGEPVAFPLFSSTVRPHDQAGAVLQVRPGQLAELPALTTILRGGKRAGRKKIPVQLEARLTEIGTLELHCASTDKNNRWKLQFQTRSAPGFDVEEKRSGDQEIVLTETWSEDQLEAARSIIRDVFQWADQIDPKQAIEVPKQLEAALGMRRAEWPTGILRGLWEAFLDCAGGRNLSIEHESRWYNLVGYCLRPGWGDPIDPFRVEQLWKTVHAGPVHEKEDRAWSEYWIVCRRIAGGLDAARQFELSKRLLAYLPLSGPKKHGRRPGSHELAEIWRTVASLEHIPVATKAELGKRLVYETRSKPIPIYLFWSLARIGARVPLYGPANLVVSPTVVEEWIDTLLWIELPEVSLQHERDFALAQLARMSGDRGRDIDPAIRERVIQHLTKNQSPHHWRDAVAEVTQLDRSEQTKLFGDALPIGLTMVSAEGN